MKKSSYIVKPCVIALAAASLVSFNAGASEPAYEPIANYHSSSIFVQVGAPVGRLNIKAEDGNFSCTGFLISAKHVMTNHHCIDDKWYNRKTKKTQARKIQSATFELGYIDPANKQNTKKYKVKLPAIEASEKLDYAILEVEGNPAETFGYLSVSTASPLEKMPLWIIGHPRGKPQQISRIKCLSITPIQKRHNRLQHTCPAVPGSSGSPVFDASTGQVIAIHNAGYTTKTNLKIGLAVPLSDIAKHSKLLRKIIDAK